MLIAALLFLLALTLLGIGVFETTLLQAKMAQNFQQQSIALQRAETALQLAELNIDGNKQSYRYDSADFSYYYALDSKACSEQQCYLITAIGKDHKAVTTLQAMTVLEFIPLEDGSKKMYKYQLYWLEK